MTIILSFTVSQAGQNPERSTASYLGQSWSNRYFHDAVQPFTKQIVGLFDVVQAEGVREQRREIDAATANKFHQSTHAFFTARTKRRHDAMISNTCGKCFVGNRNLA